MNNKFWLAILAIVATAVMWGLSYPSIKVAVMVIPPMTLGFVRFIIASVLLYFLLKVVEPQTKLARQDMPLMSAAGLIGVTAYFFFENNGIKLTSASSASLIIATIPIMTLVGDTIIYKTKLTLVKIASVTLSTLGVYLIISANQVTGGSLAGDLLMLGAAIAWVAYSLITKPLSARYSQLAVVTYQSIFGTIALIPFALREFPQWQAGNTIVWLNVVYLAVFCSALGYYLYVYALEGLGVSITSVFLNLVPLVSVIGSYYLLQEPVTLSQLLGGAIIVCSVFLATWRKKPNLAKSSPLAETSQV